MSSCLMVGNGSLRCAAQSRPISNRRSARSTRSRRTRSRRSRTASVIAVVRLSPVSLESCLASRQVSFFYVHAHELFLHSSGADSQAVPTPPFHLFGATWTGGACGRTPGPSPFSSMNSIPAFSRAMADSYLQLSAMPTQFAKRTPDDALLRKNFMLSHTAPFEVPKRELHKKAAYVNDAL